MIYKKARAFTVMEAVINLTIMSIIIGVIYFSYDIFSKQLIFYTKYTEEIKEFNQLDVLLKKDLFLSKEMTQTSNKITLILSNNNIVTYRIVNDKVVRLYESREEIFETFVKSHQFLNTVNNDVFYFTINFKVFNDTVHAVYSKNYGIDKSINDMFLTK